MFVEEMELRELGVDSSYLGRVRHAQHLSLITQRRPMLELIVTAFDCPLDRLIGSLWYVSNQINSTYSSLSVLRLGSRCSPLQERRFWVAPGPPGRNVHTYEYHTYYVLAQCAYMTVFVHDT